MLQRLLCLVMLLVACGDDDGPSTSDAGEPDGGPRYCRTDDDCSDGAFCNGVERCRRGATESENECVPGMPPRCDDGIGCTTDSCSHLANGCRFVPIDADGDGHAALSCVTPDGELLGDDCDDNDPNRFPGNPETCTADTATHDEDCDANTFGVRDLDGDGATDDTCCNGTHCGSDCDDTRADVSTGYPEICDLIDNDCDGDVDVNTVQARWYPDDDRDGFGRDDPNPTESCAPVAGRSLYNTDLDDQNPAINPAAAEVCDGVDNDCDTRIDEGDVCLCGRPGTAPCECVSGARDCFGGLIPRGCIGGRWVAESACTGRTPVCATGRCVCVGGGTACTAVADRAPPFVIAVSPGPVTRASRSAVITVLFSEAVDPSSLSPSTFALLDHGTVVDATYSVDRELVTLIPDTALEPGRVYDFDMAAVTDLAGNLLENPYHFRFTTAPRTYVVESIGGGAGRWLSGPLSLDSNANGEALLAASYDLQMSDTVLAQSEVFARSSDGQWTARDLTSQSGTENALFAGIGVNGTHYALTTGAVVSNYFRAPSDPSWTRQPLYGAPFAALAIGGDESCAVTAQSTSLTFHHPSMSGGFTPYTFTLETAANGLSADGNASRHYVAMVGGATPTLVYRDATNGSTRREIYSAQGSQPHVAINSASRGVATWLSEVGRGGFQIPVTTQTFAFIDAVGASATPITVGAGGVHNEPHVVWLSDGAVLATRQDGNSFLAQRVEGDGSLGNTFTLGADLGGQRGGGYDVVALDNGTAILAWVHGSSAASSGNALVVARYRNASIEATEIIADSNLGGDVRLARLPGNRALLLWTHLGSSTASAIVLQ